MKNFYVYFFIPNNQNPSNEYCSILFVIYAQTIRTTKDKSGKNKYMSKSKYAKIPPHPSTFMYSAIMVSRIMDCSM